jgi:hypothetical protein
MDYKQCSLNRSIVIKNTVGMENNELQNTINISPNPSNSGIFIVNIDKNNSERLNMNLYNSIGELLMQKSILQETQEIDISKYAQGIYYLHIESNNMSKTYKLIYQK